MKHTEWIGKNSTKEATRISGLDKKSNTRPIFTWQSISEKLELSHEG